jgi:hypothetical protein
MRFLALFLLFSFSCFLYCADIPSIHVEQTQNSRTVNQWTGNTDSDWHISTNWSLNSVPISTTDIEIPGGLFCYPHIMSGLAECNNVLIDEGTSIKLLGQNWVIYGNLISYGAVECSSPNSSIRFKGSVEWGANSSLQCSASTDSLFCWGNWTEDVNSNIHATQGEIQFVGNEDSELLIYSSNSYFNNFIIAKDSSYCVTFSPLSTQALNIYGSLNIMNNGILNLSSSQDINLNGNIWCYPHGLINGTFGTIHMNGTVEQIINIGNANSTLSSLDINSYNFVTCNSDIRINHDYTLTRGWFTAPSHIYVGGNWSYTRAYGLYDSNNGIVEFVGAEVSHITLPAVFFDLTINKNTDGKVFIDALATLDVGRKLDIVSGSLIPHSQMNINGNLQIETGGSFNCSGSYFTMRLAGNFSDYNTISDSLHGYYPGSVDIGHPNGVVMDVMGTTDQHFSSASSNLSFWMLTLEKDTSLFYPEADIKVLSNLTVYSGRWMNNAGITTSVGGDLYIDGSSVWNDGTGGKIVFNGRYQHYFQYYVPQANLHFHDIQISMYDTSSTLNVFSSFYQYDNGKLTVDNGIMHVMGASWYTNGSVEINDGGQLYMNNLCYLDPGTSLTVNSGGTLNLWGDRLTPILVTHSGSEYYSLDVKSGGTISADFTTFEHLDTNGVHIESGAYVDTLHAFKNCEFRFAAPSGTLLTIDNDQELTIANPNFPTNWWDGLYNVSKNVNSGHVRFTGELGEFAGNSYELDPYGRIFWSADDHDLHFMLAGGNTNVANVCDTLICFALIQNIGTVNINTSFRVDLYWNRMTPPLPYEIGDRHVIVTSLPVGTPYPVQFNPISSDMAGTIPVWIQIDCNQMIDEPDETNNIWGPMNFYFFPIPDIGPITIQYLSWFQQIEVQWNYPVWVNRFNVYKSTDPYGTYTKVGATGNGHTYWDLPNNQMMFYKVTAERDHWWSKKAEGDR